MYMNKLIKKQLVLILFTVVLVGTLVVTTSFAVFEDTKSNAQDQKMAVGDLDITFTGGSAINITNLSPMTDETAKSQTNNLYTFSIANTGTVPYKFTVKLENNPSYTSNLLPHKYIRYSLNNATAKFVSDNSGVIEVGTIEAGTTNNYSLRLWVADAETYKLPDSSLGQEIHLQINVDGKAGSILAPAPDGWYDASSGTLLAALRDSNTLSEPQTTPGSATSTSTEAVLASTQDDYGTSYYFRGAVTNNFVEYANMCWRIVRVTGDGSIKLVLYNYNGLTSTNNTPSSSTPCNVTGDTYAFARYEGDTYTSKFNSSYNDNAYVGLMYGAVSASSYAEAQANTNASTILTNLNKWYTNVLSQQSNFSDSQLADTIWCNDKSVVTDATFNPGKYTLGTNYGYGDNINYYSASKRLVQASSFSAGGTGPSLICPNDHTGGKLSKFTVSDTTYGNGALSGYAKVGLLTADEIAFAGGAFGTSNSTYYIKGNTYSNMWWALSPNDFDGSFACVWVVTDSGSYLVGGSVGDRGGVRPSLSLQSGVKISSSGIGSATNPYKIAG
ncbi:MAG: hypothetical protein MST00_01960 [Tenericutes bacterium]|nr:hypothetical protein [Mycoplasmatota bacterium]